MKASRLSIRKKDLKTILRDALNAGGRKKARETVSEAAEIPETDGDAGKNKEVSNLLNLFTAYNHSLT